MTTAKIAGYTCIGDTRGQCGVKHATRREAEKCCESDRRGCARQGGYSDRQVAEIGDDGYLYEDIVADRWIAGIGGRTSGAARSEAE